MILINASIYLKNIFGLVTSIVNACNRKKCLSLNNQQC